MGKSGTSANPAICENSKNRKPDSDNLGYRKSQHVGILEYPKPQLRKPGDHIIAVMSSQVVAWCSMLSHVAASVSMRPGNPKVQESEDPKGQKAEDPGIRLRKSGDPIIASVLSHVVAPRSKL
eukprot:gene13093-biopygen6525